MKKIINGKVYNTETAKRIGDWEPNPYRSDFHWFCETLYQKKTGEFFLHGDGNAASRYSRSCGQNEWCGDERIIPISFTDAQKWAEEHLDGEDYCEIFGEPDEDEEDVLLGVRVSAAAAAQLKNVSAQTGISQNKLIESLINEYLKSVVKRWVNSIYGKDGETL